MPASFNLHIYRTNAGAEGDFKVDSHVQHSANKTNHVVTMYKGGTSVTLFFEEIEDMEKLEFHLSTLIRQAYEERENSTEENSK